MNSPTERRERQLEKAEKVRDFLGKTDSVRDLSARATLMHDRVADSVRDICSQESGCFDEKQITVLADIAVHVALLMDPNQKKPKGAWGRFWYEFRELGMLARVGTVSGIVALLIGLASIGTWAVKGVVQVKGWYDINYAQKIPPEALEKEPIADSGKP